jgi:PAS domain-containing protein
MVVNAAPQAGDGEQDPAELIPSAVFCALDNSAMGFVITDSNFQLEYANRGFLDMIKVDSPHSVKGTALARWLGFSDGQITSLGEQLANRRAIGDFVTTLRVEQEAPRAVTIAVVPVPDGPNALYGFCIRELARLH